MEILEAVRFWVGMYDIMEEALLLVLAWRLGKRLFFFFFHLIFG